MTKLFKILIFTVFLGSIFFVIGEVEAVKTIRDADSTLGDVVSKTDIDTAADLPIVVGRIIKVALYAAGILFFVLMIYGGITWMTARGSEEQIKKGQGAVTQAFIGIIILVAAFAITTFVNERIVEKQKVNPNATTPDSLGDEKLGCCIYWEVAADDTENETSAITTEDKCGNKGNHPSKNPVFHQGWDADKCENSMKNPLLK